MPVTMYVPSTFQTGFVSISSAIWTYINSNPGATVAQLVAGTGYTSAQISAVIEIMTQQFLIVRRHASDGTACYWKSSQYETLVVSKLADARSWLSTHNGSDVSALATALSVHYGVATGLAEALQAEMSCKLYYA